MCIICTGDYDNTLNELNCSYCINIKNLPTNLTNIKTLNIYKCPLISIIPVNYMSINKLIIGRNNINEFPYYLFNVYKLSICPDMLLNIEKNKKNKIRKLDYIKFRQNRIKRILNSFVNSFYWKWKEKFEMNRMNPNHPYLINIVKTFD